MSGHNGSGVGKIVKTIERIRLGAWARGWNDAALGRPFNPGVLEEFRALAFDYENARLWVVEAKAAGIPVKPIRRPALGEGRAPWPKHVLEVSAELDRRGVNPYVGAHEGRAG